MRAPKTVRQAETAETATIKQTATAALWNRELSDGEANGIIEECNTRLRAAGMPEGGLVLTREQYRNAFPGLSD